MQRHLSMRKPCSFPKHPTGFYKSYLDSLVERARAKREGESFVADRQFNAAVEIHEPLEELPRERAA
jgi:hypothetical protein